MGQAVLTIRPELGSGEDRTPVASHQRVDLSSRRDRRYIFPEPIEEFERDKTITLTLKSDGSPLNVYKSEEAARLKTDGETQVRYERDLSGKARQGLLKDQITVESGGVSHRVVIMFPMAGDDLDQKQYDLMLEDISHWLHASLHRKTEHETKPETRDADDESLKADIETFYRVRRHVNKLDSALKRVSRSPEEEIKNTYKQTHGDSYRQDARTLRWNEARSGLPESLTYEPTQTYNVYENKFIVFVISQVDNILMTVKKSAVKTEQKLGSVFRETKKLYSKGQRDKREVRSAEEDYQRSVNIIEEISDLRSRLQKMRKYPFLRSVEYNPSQFKVSSTLTLTQNIDYSRIFSIYKEIRKEKRLRRLSNISNFVEGINTMGVRKTSQVYEYWIFFLVYKTLLKIGFAEDQGNDLIKMIDHESLTPGLMSGGFVDLYYEETSTEIESDSILNGLMIRLHYEKSFYWSNSANKEKARPDVTIEVFENRRYPIGRFIIDAKYKTKSTSREGAFKGEKPNKNGYTQAEKYQNNQVKNGRIEKGMGAFFLHLDVEEEHFDFPRCAKGDRYWHGHFAALPDDVGRLEALLEGGLLKHRIPQALDGVFSATD